MGIFSKYKCPICNIKFKDSDDIVVCPICGTPHHRGCFTKLGHCSQKELHDLGITFAQNMKNIEIEEEKQNKIDSSLTLTSIKENSGGLFCTECGALNPIDGLYCTNCGNRLLISSNKSKSKKSSINLSSLENISIEGIPSKEYAAFIGVNIDYFLNIFNNFKGKKRRSFNLCALFFPNVYLFYRKMWLLGVVFNILSVVFISLNSIFYIFATKMAPNPLILNTIFTISAISISLLIIFNIFLGLYFNFIYYKKVINNIKKYKKHDIDKEKYYKKLQKKGYTSVKGGFTGSLILFFSLLFGTFIMSI